MAQSLRNLAVLYVAQGRYAEAEPLFQRAVAIYEVALGPEDLCVLGCLDSLAEIYDKQDRSDERERVSERAAAIRKKLLAPTSESEPGQGTFLAILGRALILMAIEDRACLSSDAYGRFASGDRKSWRIVPPWTGGQG